MYEIKKEIYLSFVETAHDSSIAMLYEGKTYAIELERLSRLKNFKIKEGDNSFLRKRYFHEGMQYLLSIIGDYSHHRIVGFFGFGDTSYELESFTFDYPVETEYHFLDRGNVKDFLQKNQLLDEHHFFHGSSSYFPSGFQESAILVIDNSGYEGEGSLAGTTFSQSIHFGKGSTIEFIEGTKYCEGEGIYGIGAIYSAISDIVGLESGSVMGLSAYGEKNRFAHMKLFQCEDGKAFFFQKGLPFSGLKPFLEKFYGVTQSDYVTKGDITHSLFADIASHLQTETERAVEYLGKRAQSLTGSKNLCIAGGVGLNVLSNTLLARNCGFDNCFVPSAVGDQGISLGGLYYLYHIIKGNPHTEVTGFSANMGKTYSENEIEKAIESHSHEIIVRDFDPEFISEELRKNKIVAIFSKGSEFGPRALGYRSILASIENRENNLRVNSIKSRETWRPLAPIIMEEHFQDFLEERFLSPYMTLSSEVKKGMLEKFQGVVHVDGTVRYQTVGKENGALYEVLSAFYKKTGIPALINTSLNVKGEPIVETPNQAIELFLSTDLDYLILGNHLVSKEKRYNEYAFDYQKNLFDICLSEKEKKHYTKARSYAGKILLPHFDENTTDFCFLNRETLSFKVKTDTMACVINVFKIPEEGTGCYFRHDGIGYNFSGYIDSLHPDITNITNRINYMLKNNYSTILTLFLFIDRLG